MKTCQLCELQRLWKIAEDERRLNDEPLALALSHMSSFLGPELSEALVTAATSILATNHRINWINWINQGIGRNHAACRNQKELYSRLKLQWAAFLLKCTEWIWQFVQWLGDDAPSSGPSIVLLFAPPAVKTSLHHFIYHKCHYCVCPYLAITHLTHPNISIHHLRLE